MKHTLIVGDRSRQIFLIGAMVLCWIALTPEGVLADDRPLVLEDNLKVLKAGAPDENYRFVGSNAPGQLFLPGEQPALKFDFAKGGDQGTVRDFAVEIQEITTRDPDARSKGGFTDTSGNAPLIAVAGQATKVPLEVHFTDKPRAEFEVKNFPLPEKFGTYALILTRGEKRQFLATLARVPQPRADGSVDNVPIFGEGVLIDHDGRRAEYYARDGSPGLAGGDGLEREGGWIG